MALYADAGVREYWIVDPATEQTTLYRFEETDAPAIIPFNQDIPVGIYKNLQINIADLLQQTAFKLLTVWWYQNPGKRLAMSLFAGILITTD